MASFNILLAIFLWSSLGVVVRLSGVPVYVLIFYSSIVAVIIQGTILSFRGYRKELPDIGRLRYPVILGVIGLLNTFAYFYAFKNTTIANAVLTHYTAPVFVAFLAPVFLKETITRLVVISIILASTGLYLMLDGLSFSGGHTGGIIAGLVSGFAYAVVVILARVYTQSFAPLVLTFFPNIVVLVLLAPFIRQFPLNALWSFIVMGTLHSTIAPLLYYKGLRHVTANRAAVLGYLEPVSAIIFSMLFLNEMPGMTSLAGGLLIIFSGYLTLKS